VGDGLADYLAVWSRVRFPWLAWGYHASFKVVRAAFYVATAPARATAYDAAMECFTILDNFNIPIGIEYPAGKAPEDIPSATQWTSVSDLANLDFYYKTMYNSTVRKVSLKDIDFGKVKYQTRPLDENKLQAVEELKFK
jgi:choloylglycine hydrolase